MLDPVIRSLSPLVLMPGRERRKRVGRGFSPGELREAGMSEARTRTSGIPVDRRRKTVHPWNVEALGKLALVQSP